MSEDPPIGETSPPKESEPPVDKPAEGQALGRMDLPKWNRARVKRKAPKGSEEDAFQGSVRQAGRAAVRRAPWLLLGVLGVCAALAGGIYWHDRQTQSEAEATRMLADAVAHRARGRVGDPAALGLPAGRTPPIPLAESQEALDKKTLEALDGLAEERPDSAAAILAHLVRGAQALEAGDGAKAEAAYREYLDANGPPAELVFLAKEGLGMALEAQGKAQEALEVYRGLASEGGYYKDMALAHEGRVLEDLGKRDEAIAVYRNYTEAFPLTDPSLARDFVRERLAELDPAAIAPPAEPDAENLDDGPAVSSPPATTEPAAAPSLPPATQSSGGPSPSGGTKPAAAPSPPDDGKGDRPAP